MAAVAVASLDDLVHLRGNVAVLVAERERVIRELNALDGVEAYQSAANFVLARLPVADTKDVTDELEAHKVHVRRYGGSLASCIRVSIGTPDQNDAFLMALTAALSRVPAR